VPRQHRAQLQVHAPVVGSARQYRIGAQQRGQSVGRVLHAGMHQLRALGQVHVHQGVGQVPGGAGVEVVLDQLQPRAAAQLDQVAMVPGQVRGAFAGGAGDRHQVHRRFHHGVLVHAQQRALVGQRGVEPGEDLVGPGEAAAEEAQCLVAAGQGLRQRLQRHARGQAGKIRQRGHVAAIDEYQARGGDGGQPRRVQRGRLQRRGDEAAPFQLAQ
jgi:hypothetical protein